MMTKKTKKIIIFAVIIISTVLLMYTLVSAYIADHTSSNLPNSASSFSIMSYFIYPYIVEVIMLTMKLKEIQQKS